MTQDGVPRRLAAIVAADIVGYSRLMSEDETGTLSRLTAATNEIVEPTVSRYGGRIVKTTGDGALIEFPSAVDAVLCAVSIQREMTASQADIPTEKRLQYRIGINLGDIIVEGDDIFGDGVNVAARLEGLAEPGGIRISDTVFQSVKGKLDLGFADLGPQKVKNLADPIAAYQVLLDPEDAGKLVEARGYSGRNPKIVVATILIIVIGVFGSWFTWDRYLTVPPVPVQPTLLILPFKADTDTAALYADGATANLLSSLALLKGMKVVPWSIVIQYKGMNPDLDVLARELSFHYVLMGVSARLMKLLRFQRAYVLLTAV